MRRVGDRPANTNEQPSSEVLAPSRPQTESAPDNEGRVSPTQARQRLQASLAVGVRPPLERPVTPEKPSESPKDEAAAASSNVFSQTVAPSALATAGLGFGAYTLYTSGDVPTAILGTAAGVVAGLAMRQAAKWFSQPPAPERKPTTLTDSVHNPDPKLAFSNAADLINHYAPGFEAVRNFRVGDARSFAGNIAENAPEDQQQALQAEVLARADKPPSAAAKVVDAERRLKQAAATMAGAPSEKTLKQVAADVLTAQSGVCTTFAGLAAHALTRGGLEKKIPVEIIARQMEGKGAAAQASTHLFTLVGRKPGSELSRPETWGPDARIVDLWLGALANPIVYRPDEYTSWLSGATLSQVYTNQPKAP